MPLDIAMFCEYLGMPQLTSSHFELIGDIGVKIARWVFQSTHADRINVSVAARILFKLSIQRYCESASCKGRIEQHLLCI